MGVANNEALAQEVPWQRGGGVLQARAPGKHDIRAEGSAGVGTPPTARYGATVTLARPVYMDYPAGPSNG
jgi:hypothetical protein